VAILCGVALALAVALEHPVEPEVTALLVGGVLVALAGLADDRFGLPPLPRVLVHGVAAFVVIRASGGLPRLPLPPPLDVQLGAIPETALAIVWIVAVINFYNFMDGIDGLAALQAVVTAGALAVVLSREAPSAAVVAAALAAASAGFLVYNRPPASIFMGDVGSGLLGYTVGSLALLAPAQRRSEAVLLVGLSLFLFLADTTTCLLARVVRGERWLEAHREHLYQRWVAAGAGHGTVSSWLGGAALVTTLVAVAGWWTRSPLLYWVALVLGVASWALEWAVVRRRESTLSGDGGEASVAP
jgi:Fuc2NAc and GlcNAc transferase